MRTDAAAGVFVAALVLGLISLREGWKPLVAISAVVIVGVLVATSRQRRTGPDPETVIQPGGDKRPWRRRDEDS